MLQARLITRRSQVQILPPLLRRRSETAPFRDSEAGMAGLRALVPSALDVLRAIGQSRVIFAVVFHHHSPSGPQISFRSGERWSRHPHRPRQHRGPVRTGPDGRGRLPALGRPHTARRRLPDDAKRAVRDADLRPDAYAARGRHQRRGLGLERELVRQGADPRRERRREDALHRHRAAGGGREVPRNRRPRECPGPRLRSLPCHISAGHGRRTARAADRAVLLGGLRFRSRDADADLEGARRRLVGSPDERRRLAWRRCRRRPRRQGVVPALGRDRGAPRRRARHRGKHRIDRPCRADAPATAFATGASYRGAGSGDTPAAEPPDRSTEEAPPS